MGGEDESIEQAVTSRKERLQALKAAQQLLSTPDDDVSSQADGTTNDDDQAAEEQYVSPAKKLVYKFLTFLFKF